MSGRGFCTNRRNPIVLTDDFHVLCIPPIRRLARSGGVKHISGVRYEVNREFLKFFFEKVIGDYGSYSEFASSNNVMDSDAYITLKCQRHTLHHLGK